MEKYLVDESVDFRIIKYLRNKDFNVDAVIEQSPGINDKEVLKLANSLDAILITEDKDFG